MGVGLVTGFVAQSVIVSTSRCLVSDPTDGDSSSSVPTSSLSGEYLTTLLFAPTILVITSWHRPHRKYCCCVAVQLLLIESVLPSSGCCYLATCLYATLCCIMPWIWCGRFQNTYNTKSHITVLTLVLSSLLPVWNRHGSTVRRIQLANDTEVYQKPST
jgi:hypothetical protein